MDARKLAFSEQILSPRRKVVPGFGLGIGISLIFLSILLLYNSSQGKSFFSASNTSTNVDSIFGSWSFSFSSPNLTSSSFKLGTSHDSGEGNHATTDLTSLQNNTITQSIETVKNESLRIGDEGSQLNGPNMSEVTNTSLFNESENVTGSGGISGVGEKKFPKNSTFLNNNSTDYQNERNNQFTNGELASFNASLEGNGTEKSAGRIDISHDSNPQLGKSNSSFYDDCDIFDGKWVRDDSKPYYPPGSCPFIDRDFDCYLNKRPDDGYVKWRWQPNACDIPSLNATDFLEKLRGKSLVFVGDSLNRNMWESLACILRDSISDKSRVYEISGRTEFKKKDFYAIRFEDYNCSVDFVSTPFLVKESSFKRRNETIETLKLDEMDKTTEMYQDADVLVFNTGHWWTHEKTSKGEDYYQEGNYVHPKLKVLEAFKRALATWGRWVDQNVDKNRTLVLFRGYSYSHFSGGQWNTGGQCHKQMEPIYNTSHLGKYPKKMRALEHVLHDMKTPVGYLNITRLTHYRRDAHPSIYRMEYKTEAERRAGVRAQDCSHWCLPGVPDTWNELLYASVLKMAKRAWTK